MMDHYAAMLPPVKPTGQDVIAEAVRIVAKRYGVDESDVLSPGKRRNKVRMRWEVFWLARKAGLSYPCIAEICGCDHSTVHYGVRRIESLMDDLPNGMRESA